MASYREAIQAYATAATAHQARISAGIDGVSADVAAQNELILKLQTNPGPITPEDQAILDQLQSGGDALASKLEALDALNPPAVPPVTP